MYLFLLSEYFVFTLNYFPYYKLSNFPQVKKNRLLFLYRNNNTNIR